MGRLLGVVLALIYHVVSAQEYARVLFDNTTYTITEGEVATIEEHYKVRILSEEGYRHAVFFDYTDKFQKIDQVSVEVFDHTGKKVKSLRKGNGLLISVNPYDEVSDAKVLVIDPAYRSYPMTVEVKKRVRRTGFISLPPWVPRHDFHIGVDKASLEVVRGPETTLNFWYENISPQQDNSNPKVIVNRFEISSLPSIDEKLRFEDFLSMQPKVYVSPMTFELDNVKGSNGSWKEFGNWFLKLNSDPFVLSQATRDFIQSLDKGDRTDAVGKIYAYMQDRTRYVSIQLGIGGFKSLPTEEVERFGYGDCKALTTYMKNMLDFAGIPSNFILVHAGKNVPDVIAEFPSNQFNHVFLGVPNGKDTVFLECTSQVLPAGYIGAFTDSRNVLWIDKEESSILRSHTYDHTESKRHSQISITLEPTGDAVVKQIVDNEGIFFDDFMTFKLAPSDWLKEHIQEKFGYPDYVLQSYGYDHPDRAAAHFTTNYLVRVGALGKVLNDRIVLPAFPAASFRQYIDGSDLKRYYEIKRGITIEDEVEVEFPSNYWLYRFPDETAVDSPFGHYYLGMKYDGQKLKITRKLVLFKGDYTGDQYEKFRLFYQQMEAAERGKLVFNSKT
jgi:hypothetical protein